ncbi:helix-turn-helix transcriptional regulator [Alteromonadaceae bacterium BrNp21-10]|nr:helix-turn-helix transcriptional regulator [Alteromonadaceae bacterium BrNp21-10]
MEPYNQTMEYAHNLTTFALLIATMGMLSLSIPVLLLGAANRSAKVPLVSFLLFSGLANGLPALIEFYPPLELYGLAIFLPCYLLVPASLWLYVQAITSPIPWRFSKPQIKHFVPACLALMVSSMLVALPRETLANLFINDNASPISFEAELIVLCAFALLVLWVLLSAMYVIKILLKLTRYRIRLKELFANNEQRELLWLSWVVLVLAITWLVSLLYSIPLLTNQALPLPIEIIGFMHFCLLWLMSLFGIKQQPGFEGRYLKPEKDTQQTQVDNETLAKKYQKSGLGDQQLQRIADKVENAMSSKKLYLDPSLSLMKLASETQVSANYLSQVLNEHIGKSFFDYINSLRIQHAIPEVVAAEKTILDIAMDTGFNARSSFYKAFKNETGLTPSEYRIQKSM